MRKLLLVAISLFTGIGFLAAQEEVSEAKWQSTPVTIDGNDSEWKPPFNLFDNKTGLIFTISNDNKNLYLCFTEHEELKAEKIMKAGWTIELSSSEKKRKFDATISFPKIDDPNISLRAEYSNQVNYYKMNLASIKTKGFADNNGDVQLVNNNGVNIGIGSEGDQKIIYEIAIPLKELAGEMQLNELITLDVSVNGINRPTAASGTPISRSGFGGRGGGGGGGRMGGGRRGGGGNQQSANTSSEHIDIFEKASFKQKFRLVKQ
jgi:uncharacterized membrane protein YgcG